MNYNVNKVDFVKVLVDCKGYGREEAEELAGEYRNDLGAWISDIGGDENSLAEAKAFLGKSNVLLNNQQLMLANNMFEDFLKQKHHEQNPMVLDDDLTDHFELWLSNLDIQEVIDYAEEAIVTLAPKVVGKLSASKRDTSSETMRNLVNRRWNKATTISSDKK